MGPKRGFVTVVNGRVPYWSSKIQANAAGARGLVSVPLRNRRSHPGLERVRGRDGRKDDGAGAASREGSGRVEQRSTEQGGEAECWRREGNAHGSKCRALFGFLCSRPVKALFSGSKCVLPDSCWHAKTVHGFPKEMNVSEQPV